MNIRGERHEFPTRMLVALLATALLAAACGAAAPTAPGIPTDTPQINALAPLVMASSTAETGQLPAAETFTPTSAPFELQFTPLPTETALPTVEIPTEAARPPELQVWDGLPTYPAESRPDYYFRLSFDPNAWALTVDNYGMPALAHRAITGCLIAPTAGRGLPPNAVAQHEVRRIGAISYQISSVDVNGVRQSITYAGGDGRIYTAFQLSLADRPDQCILEAEAALGTLTSVLISEATPIATP